MGGELAACAEWWWGERRMRESVDVERRMERFVPACLEYVLCVATMKHTYLVVIYRYLRERH